MDIKRLVETLHPLERKVLPVLEKASSLSEIVEQAKLQEVEAMRALQWLQNKGAINLKEEVKEIVLIDSNGKRYVKDGLPERRFLSAIKNEATISEIAKKSGISNDEINICLGILRSKAAIEIRKEKEMIIKITEQGKRLLEKESLEERFLKKEFPVELCSLKEEEKFALESLKKRKDIIRLDIKKIKTAELTEIGKKLAKESLSSEEILDSLTSDMLKASSWKNKKFRRYDVKINVPAIYGGKRHFAGQAVEYIKKIWLELGFKEMSGNIIQTSFWDLDALFVPQDHPARQMQDTFYIKEPSSGKLPSIWETVKKVHENGGDTGSKGWGGNWSDKIAKENLLRTHTTVLSARAIAKLKKSDMPAKFFSVSKVFRNEAVDWKHLFELTQVEGIVVDPNSNFRNLKGYLREFFAKMGYPKIRIRPAHFPYTEPSCECDVWHPVKEKWVELGGAGIFRPEVTKPLMGIEVPVLAWGLGMERSIMEYYNLIDIRDIYKNDLKQLREMKTWMR